ncbi:hypothetical protein ONS96_007786 [Cadophora gregata f. sp. sojae]|nr:hypothetical protein ONS96_007786 [Cadophora gregata f. sp. sojae]
MEAASQNQDLTDGLLHSCLDHCLASNPLQLGERFRYIPRSNFDRCPQRRPIGKVFIPENSGPFSWTERQRVSRHMWRVQLLFYLKLKSPNFHWTTGDVAHLESLDIFSFWDLSDRKGNFREQLGTVVYYLKTTRQKHGSPLLRHSAAAQVLNPVSNASPVTQTPWDIPLPLDHYILNTISTAERLVRGIRTPTSCVYGPPRYYSLEHWREFGFYIWDDKRMYSLGFLFQETCAGDRRPFTTNFTKDDMWFRWESVLSQDIIEANERRRLAEFPD